MGPEGVGARRVGARRVGGPKFRVFFSLPPEISFFLLSLWGGLLVEFWWFLNAGTLKCARLEFSGCRVKPRQPQSRQGFTRRLGKDLRLNGDWLWYVVKALHGMRILSKAFQEVVRLRPQSRFTSRLSTCAFLTSHSRNLLSILYPNFSHVGSREALDPAHSALDRTI